MPFNKLKKYSETLDVDYMRELDREISLKGVFERDFISSGNSYRGRNIIPTPQDGKTAMEVLFLHLTRKTESPDTRNRIYDRDRAIRIHWIKHHFCNCDAADYIEVFSVRDRDGIRTYIFNEGESYVIILEPRGDSTYFLITAYYLQGANTKKIQNKKRRKLNEIH